jgi:hypothetical protein
MTDEIASAELQRLLGISKSVLNESKLRSLIGRASLRNLASVISWSRRLRLAVELEDSQALLATLNQLEFNGEAPTSLPISDETPHRLTKKKPGKGAAPGFSR